MKFTTKIQLINYLIGSRGYKSYLEIGIDKGINFNKVEVKKKVGVDPAYPVGFKNIYRMTSDDFFKRYSNKYLFDMTFIDGMHLCECALRDFMNAEKCASLSNKPCILIHDCNPPTEEQAGRERKDAVWNGDVWKMLTVLDKYRPDLHIRMFDTDQGITLVENLDPDFFWAAILDDHLAIEMITQPFEKIEEIRDKYLCDPVMED